jgi:hypothetical protein
MALRAEFGDDGLSLWALSHDDTVTPDVIATKWKSFDREAKPGAVTLPTFMRRAHQLGWTGTIRSSAASMFAGVAQFAAIGSPPLAPGTPGPQVPDPTEMAPARLLKKLGGWMREFVLPEYLWDGILIKRFCYSLTAQTGAGKTAVAMLLAVYAATGEALCGRHVERGSVIYLAGENPTDVQMRFLGLCHMMGIDWDTLDIHIIEGTMDISKHADQFRAECEAFGLKPSLVIVDTAAAYFPGDNDNDNAQMGSYARQLRELCKLPGGPCVLVLCHPTKGAKEIGEMVPRGGGAFLNEVDGNLAAARDVNLIAIQALGKFRGPEFAPLHFGLHTVWECPALYDTKKGKHLPTVVAQAVSEAGAAARAMETETSSIRLVQFIYANPKASFVQIATEFKVNKSKAERMVNDLINEKLVKRDKLTGKLTLTPSAQTSLNDMESDRNRGEATMMPFPGIPGTKIL